MNIILLYFVNKYDGNWDKVYNALDKLEKVSHQEIAAFEKKIADEKVKYISILDLDYPKQLKAAYKPPFVLFYEGNRKLLDEKLIAYTGDKPLGKDVTASHVHELEKSYALVTNTANDVDKEVQQNASKGMLIITNGQISDSLLKPLDKDLVISEHMHAPKLVDAKSTLSSDRLLAALSEKLILTSSQENEVTKSQVTNFLNLGKDIDCFAHEGENFNSKLIQMGANLITDIKSSAKDVPVKDEIEAIGVITNQLQRDGLNMDEFEIFQENHPNGKYFVAFTGTAEEPQDFGSGDTYKWRLDKASNHLIASHHDEDKFDRDGCDIADHGKLIDHKRLYQAREIDCKASELQEARKHAKDNSAVKAKDKSLAM